MREMDKRIRRSVGLDLLRCVLCAGVVFHHYRYPEPGVGAFMVVGFFVMSGYLLGTMLHRSSTLNIQTFFRRKSVRLLPMLFCSLAVGFAFRLYYCFQEDDFSSLVPEVNVGNMNWIVFISHYNLPSWFVLVEICFILLVPFVFFLVKKRGMFEMFAFFMFLVAYILHAQVPGHVYLAGGLYTSVVARVWQICAGILVAGLVLRYPRLLNQINYRNILLIFLSVIFVVSSFILGGMDMFADLACWVHSINFEILAALLFVCLIPLLSNTLILERYSGIAEYVSQLTYPIYLIHVPFYWIMIRLLNSLAIRFGVDWMGAHVVVAWVSLAMTILFSVIMLRIQKRYIDKYSGGVYGPAGRSPAADE